MTRFFVRVSSIGAIAGATVVGACGGSSGDDDLFAPSSAGGSSGTSAAGGAGATGGSAGATGGSAGATTGGSAGATGGSAGATGGSAGATGGSAGATTGGSAGATTGGSAGATTGGSAGATTGGSAGATTGGSAGATGGSGGSAGGGAGTGGAGTGGAGMGGAGGAPAATCADAAKTKSNVGCEFWPTVTGNPVWDIFDFAVLVSNPGTEPADVQVTRNKAIVASVTVPPGGSAPVYLPWVPELKGPQTDACGSVSPVTASVGVLGGAYRMTSTRPVAAWQFNALEAKGEGGPAGKSWASCPGLQTCASSAAALGCFSFSNDASILLPTASLGTSYRVVGAVGWTEAKVGPQLTVTAVEDGTSVQIKLGPTAAILAGTGITGAGAGALATLTLNQGDVAQLVGTATTETDFSGSLVTSNKPVQVISSHPCSQMPIGTQACDHLEETQVPVEALGTHYIVPVPTGPAGTPVQHVVRMVAQVTTAFTYVNKPPGAPDGLTTGQVAQFVATAGFEVSSATSFVVASFLPGGAVLDPSGGAGQEKGDPSMTLVVPVERFRGRHLVAVPAFDIGYLDVVQPSAAIVKVDGSPVSATSIPGTTFSIARVPAKAGVHAVVADQPVTVSFVGFAPYASVHYPGGL